MMEDVCKNFERCPIYSGILAGQDLTANDYKMRYCEAGERGWVACKRYQVREITGQCPPMLLPNSARDVRAILNEMNYS